MQWRYNESLERITYEQHCFSLGFKGYLVLVDAEAVTKEIF